MCILIIFFKKIKLFLSDHCVANQYSLPVENVAVLTLLMLCIYVVTSSRISRYPFTVINDFSCYGSSLKIPGSSWRNSKRFCFASRSICIYFYCYFQIQGLVLIVLCSFPVNYAVWDYSAGAGGGEGLL